MTLSALTRLIVGENLPFTFVESNWSTCMDCRIPEADAISNRVIETFNKQETGIEDRVAEPRFKTKSNYWYLDSAKWKIYLCSYQCVGIAAIRLFNSKSRFKPDLDLDLSRYKSLF